MTVQDLGCNREVTVLLLYTWSLSNTCLGSEKILAGHKAFSSTAALPDSLRLFIHLVLTIAQKLWPSWPRGSGCCGSMGMAF